MLNRIQDCIVISFLVCDFATEMRANQMPDSTAGIVDGRTIWVFNTDSDGLAFEVDMKQRIISQSVEELCSGSVATMTFSPNDVSAWKRAWLLKIQVNPYLRKRRRAGRSIAEDRGA
ncbi:MAG TPA: hypothetical protein VFD58_16775 [Blastocatellia bacterium]|nr:hypothetical protein [Blastocatellia bacterium]